MREYDLDSDEHAWQHASVSYSHPHDDSGARITIRGGYGGVDESTILLDAAQALLLLEWLTSERDKLEVLAKQDGTKGGQPPQ